MPIRTTIATISTALFLQEVLLGLHHHSKKHHAKFIHRAYSSFLQLKTVWSRPAKSCLRSARPAKGAGCREHPQAYHRNSASLPQGRTERPYIKHGLRAEVCEDRHHDHDQYPNKSNAHGHQQLVVGKLTLAVYILFFHFPYFLALLGQHRRKVAAALH